MLWHRVCIGVFEEKPDGSELKRTGGGICLRSTNVCLSSLDLI